MINRNWLACQLLIIISTPLEGLITEPACESNLDNKAFEVTGFYFWAPCNYNLVKDAEDFCSDAGGWLHEPKTKDIVDFLENAGLGEPFYHQGLEYIEGSWKWLQGGIWDKVNPMRLTGDIDDSGKVCSEYKHLEWQDKDCTINKRRYICQFKSCSSDGDCNQYEYCDTSKYDDTMTFCTCKEGYSGTRCTDDYCDLNVNTCINGGTCEGTTVAPFYKCYCAVGFYGETCANNYCDGNPCQNGGSCQADTSDYMCDCKPGYYGETCANRYCAEHDNICQNQGTCNDVANDPYYRCDCKPGYYGENCENDHCAENPGICTNGTCQPKETDSYYECSCAPGFYGQNCAVGYCEQFGSPCENGGSCHNVYNGSEYSCKCTVEYTGKNCTDPLYYEKGDCFYHININKTGEYDVARQTCHDFDGELAMVKNASIQDFLNEKIKMMYDNSAVELWIGGENNATWIWLDGEIITTNHTGHDNWADGEPKIGDESVLMKGVSGEYLWYGEIQSYDHGGIICEKPGVDDEKLPCSKDRDPCVNGTCQAIGCQAVCICEKGYFQRYCNADLITISSPDELIGVENEDLTIQLEILTFDGNVTIAVTKNDGTEDNITDVTNGTTDYLITNLQNRDSEGTYTFSASSDAGGYSRTTTTSVIVHVRAYVDALGTSTIYAPQSNNEGCAETVTCTVGGIPHPTEYGWYRNGVKLNNSSDGGVYQTFDDTTNSTLYVQNAALAERGEYHCYAANKVANESNISSATTGVTLSVYSAPSEVNPTGKPCLAEGEIEVGWMPGVGTNEVDHSFRIFATTSTDDEIESETANNGTKVTFTGLDPYTEYEIIVEVCPESQCCISKLSKMGSATTGHGLPGDVSARMNGKGTSVCEVSWSLPLTPPDQIEGYNVSWIAKIRSNLSYPVDDIEDEDYVIAPKLNYSLQTKPNKVYEVKVSARTCAGNGNDIVATGECWTPIDGPEEVPPPLISTAENGVRQETRRVDVQMVTDESNGAISCLLVILYKESGGNLPKSFDDLQQLSANSFADKVTGGYITKAIESGDLDAGGVIPVDLGTGEDTNCDVSQTSITSQKQSDQSTVINANNVPLDYGGVEYRILSVTTTPGSDGEIIVTHSKSYITVADLPSFIQGKSLLWVIACVLVPCIIAGAVVFLWIRRRKNTPKKNDESPNFTASPLDELDNDVPYETIDVTTIPLKRLKEYYLQMEANECMLFREQFVKLKQEAKKLAPPSTYASSAEVMMKNRFKNILPYDNNRVYLKGDGSAAYINASYIKGCKKMFIATQGPLPNTIVDFWRMIVEQGVKIIVMLTKCEENGRGKCERYWPPAKREAYYGPYRIRNISEKMCGGIVTTALKIHVPEQTEITVTHYHYVRWPDHGVPQTTTTFFRLHKQVMTHFRSTDQGIPIVVHCSAGVGRTGTFIGFDVLLGESDREMNAYKCVMEMRQQRVDMVQTSDQYQMLHKLMMERQYFMETDFDRNDLLKKKNWDESQELTLLNMFDAMHPKWRQNSPSNSSNVVIVRQPEDTEWVRIDATFVEAYQDKVYFIASVGPSNSTVEYFLRALWDNFVDYVIMLNKPSEEALDNHGQFCDYWPTQLNTPETYNSITITLQSEQAARGWVERTFYLERRNQPARTIRHYQYLHWESDHAPEKPDLLLDLIQHIIRQSSNDGATVLVHCTNGLGRTGVFIALANIITRLQFENRIDVVRTVKDLKDIRPGIVQTLGDYKCCYEMARRFSMQGNVYENPTFQKEPTENEDPIYQNVGGT